MKSKLLLVVMSALLLLGCVTIDTDNYPKGWAHIESVDSSHINGIFYCYNESDSHGFKNITSARSIFGILGLTKNNYPGCDIIEFKQELDSEIKVLIHYEKSIYNEVLFEGTNYKISDGWIYFPTEIYDPYTFGAYGVGSHRIGLKLNSSGDLVAKFSKKSVGLIMFIPLVNFESDWLLFERVE